MFNIDIFTTRNINIIHIIIILLRHAQVSAFLNEWANGAVAGLLQVRMFFLQIKALII